MNNENVTCSLKKASLVFSTLDSLSHLYGSLLLLANLSLLSALGL